MESKVSYGRKQFRGAGLLFFIAAVGFILSGVGVENNLPTISAISGAFIEVVSGLNFYLYGKALDKLDTFHVRLGQTQRFLLANSICMKLESKERQSSLAKLVDTIAESPISNNNSTETGKTTISADGGGKNPSP